MEANENHSESSSEDVIDNYLKSLLHHTQYTGKVHLSNSLIVHSKNFIAVVTKDGLLENASSSLMKLLGYSEKELKMQPVNSILAKGDFKYSTRLPSYYFENSLMSKDHSTKTLKWRLISDTDDDLFFLFFVFLF